MYAALGGFWDSGGMKRRPRVRHRVMPSFDLLEISTDVEICTFRERERKSGRENRTSTLKKFRCSPVLRKSRRYEVDSVELSNFFRITSLDFVFQFFWIAIESQRAFRLFCPSRFVTRSFFFRVLTFFCTHTRKRKKDTTICINNYSVICKNCVFMKAISAILDLVRLTRGRHCFDRYWRAQLILIMSRNEAHTEVYVCIQYVHVPRINDKYFCRDVREASAHTHIWTRRIIRRRNPAH